jgi:polysaccharide biosynthesis transport protein
MITKQASRLASPRDYMALLMRRKWLIVCGFIFFAGFSLLLANIVPSVFVSRSLILYQLREVSPDLVKESANGAMDSRLTAIQETLLSRSNLLKIIREFEGKDSPYYGLSDQKKVERMRDHLLIEFVTDKTRISSGSQPITNVRITYREQSPELAQKIASRITALFIEKENREREGQVYGTASFLKSELGNIQEQMSLSSERLKELKEQYNSELPTQLDANLRTLDRLQQQKGANIEALDRQTTLQLNLEKQISETPATLSGTAQRVAVDRDPLLDVYLAKQRDYQSLEAKATDQHPDVKRLRAELDMLRKELPPEVLTRDPSAEGAVQVKAVNPVYQNLLAQLNQVKTEVEIRRREKKSVEDQIAHLNQKVQNSPQVEHIVMSAERSYAELLKQADDLREKLEQARLSENVEKKQKGAQFVIIDEANLPSDPESPNRSAVLFYGTAVSLALALIVAFSVDLSTRRVFTGAEVERIMDTPILVEIPRLVSAYDKRRARKLRTAYAALFMIGMGAYVGGLYYLFMNQSHLVKIIEPLIEKFQG